MGKPRRAGAKRIETRAWRTSYRGLLAIHTARAFPVEARALCEREPFRSALLRDEALDASRPLADQLPLGYVLAVVYLEDCQPTESIELPAEPERTFGDYGPGRYAWYFSSVYQLPQPIPARGSLGLWNIDLPLTSFQVKRRGRL